MTNPWIDHVKKYASKHSCSYGEAMKRAKSSYRRVSGGMNPLLPDPTAFQRTNTRRRRRSTSPPPPPRRQRRVPPPPQNQQPQAARQLFDDEIGHYQVIG